MQKVELLGRRNGIPRGCRGAGKGTGRGEHIRPKWGGMDVGVAWMYENAMMKSITSYTSLKD